MHCNLRQEAEHRNQLCQKIMISLQSEGQLDVQGALEFREWRAPASLCVLWHTQQLAKFYLSDHLIYHEHPKETNCIVNTLLDFICHTACRKITEAGNIAHKCSHILHSCILMAIPSGYWIRNQLLKTQKFNFDFIG